MTVTVDTDLQRAVGQLHEIEKRLLNGGLSALQVRRPLQDIIEGNFPQDTRLDRYDGLLGSLGAQLNTLRRYNEQYWEGRLADEQLAVGAVLSPRDFDPHDVHVQRVEDLEILHVQFRSLQETAEMWWRVIVGEQPDSWCWDELRLDPEHFKLLNRNIREYEPGIHRVRINLIAHWEPGGSRTLEEVREQAIKTGEILAQLEVMSAYGLHPDLLREQDGQNLPYSDMAGTNVSVRGVSDEHALCLAWFSNDSKAEFLPRFVGSSYDDWAAPVLLD